MILLALSYYELAYLEIKRILIQYPIICETQLIDEGKVDELHEIVKRRIGEKPYLKEKIWRGANRALLNYVKKCLAGIKPPQPYDYKTLVNFLNKNYGLNNARLLSKAILRLDKYLNKHFNNFYYHEMKVSKNHWIVGD